MTKPISRKMAVDCLLWTFAFRGIPTPQGAFIECTLCNMPVMPDQAIQWDHIHAIVFDGPHEYQNLRPVHAECHKKKTARDIKDNSKIKRIRGERKPKPKKAWPKGQKIQPRAKQVPHPGYNAWTRSIDK